MLSTPVSTSVGSPHLQLNGPQPNELNAGTELESLFLSVLLKEMRQAGSEDGLFPGDKSDTLGGIFDTYLGTHIAESGGIGLAEAVSNSLIPHQ